MTVVSLNLQTVTREALQELDEFQQFLRWRSTHSCLPARLPCDCGTPTVLRAPDGHIRCSRCETEENRRLHAQLGKADEPYEMHRILQRAVEGEDGGFISCGDIIRAFRADTARRYDEARTRYDDYRALHPHVTKAELATDIPDKG